MVGERRQEALMYEDVLAVETSRLSLKLLVLVDGSLTVSVA